MSGQQDMDSDARLEDRHYINEALRRWARAVDRRDWPLVRTVFHADGYDDHGMYKGGVDGLIAWLEERHKNITQSMHVLGNVFIEFAGRDAAVVETYVVAYQRYEAQSPDDLSQLVAALGEALAAGGGPVDVMMPARYVDVFERREGRWRIAERTTIFEGRYVLSTGASPALDPNWTVGRRDDTDALYGVRARLFGAQR
ncbi:MAG: nuclear transport factor 2 family protein [Gammaproteobacteria bacterium]|nr:nuclear transport factor 2 family protein [Gammaproteobacteria bacterium]